MEQEVALEMRRTSKNFPSVEVLQDVDLTSRKGEIHTLMGENGVGKSILVKVLAGVEEFETGTIRTEGSYNTIINRSPQEAQESGISMVYQGVNLCSNLSVAENPYIGRKPKKGPIIDRRTTKEDTRRLLEGLDVHTDATMAMENYSTAIQQMVAIVKVVDTSTRALILDEPTSSLGDDKVERLLVLMRQLRAKGIGIIFMAHFPEQIYVVCDRIIVLKSGTLVGEFKVEELPRVQLVAKMMGKDFDGLAAIEKEGMSMAKGDVVISTEELGCRGTIRPFSLDIHRGEVIGLTGLPGSGRLELVRAIYGADKSDNGELAVRGKELKINAPIDAMIEDMVYLPEGRKEEGIIMDLSMWENIITAPQAKKDMFKLISRKKQEEFTDRYIDILQIKTADRETPIKQLSDGDWQKVILGRQLLTSSDFLVLDESTRGIDIGTKTETQKPVLRLAEEGMAVVFISFEIGEMFRICSRIAVMHNGEKVGEPEEDELSQGSIMRAIAERGGEWQGSLEG